MIRVGVVDDQPLVRAGFKSIVGLVDDLTLVGEAADGREAIDMVARAGPDVVLMDIRMPNLDGIEATRQITAATDAKVLILTTFDLDEHVYDALRAGASGFLLKDAPPEDIIAAVRVLAAGDALLAPGVTRRLIEEFAARPAPGSGAGSVALDALTDREREVLAAVARGRSNAEIGGDLFMSPATAKTHVSRIIMKLGVRDRAQLVVAAYEAGLVTPGG